MHSFSSVQANSYRTTEMKSMQNWVLNFISNRRKEQDVVGNRRDLQGLPITQQMFHNNDRPAHVCPFVLDSIDQDLFWIEQSDLSNVSSPNIDQLLEQLLRQQMMDFKNMPPSYDPVVTGRGPTSPVFLKTFFTFFPKIKVPSKGTPFALFEDLHKKLKPDFIKAGLMLGQFYPGCPVPGIYNKAWVPGPLVSPWPAFAIRYIAKHDHLFIDHSTREYALYQNFFP